MALVVEKLIKKMWLFLSMWFTEKCYFFGFKSSYFSTPFIWAWLFQKEKFWEAMGEEISIHMAFFVWYFTAEFLRNSDKWEYYFFTFLAFYSRSSMKCKFKRATRHLNVRAHDAKLVLSSKTLTKYRDLRDLLRSIEQSINERFSFNWCIPAFHVAPSPPI